MVKITRNSSCGSLCLPVDLACVFCKPTINRYILTGNPPKKIKKCIRPFDMKWKNHREQSKVDICNRIHNYINNDTKENTIDHTCTDLSIDMICEDVGNNHANVIACKTPIEDLNHKYVDPSPFPRILLMELLKYPERHLFLCPVAAYELFDT